MPYPLIWTHVAVLFLFLWHSVLKGGKICANFFHVSPAVTFIQIRKAKWILGFLKFPKIVFSSWILWNHWVLLSLSKGCLPAMITIVIHKRSPAKISTKIFARHRHRQHDHGDGQTVLPLTWLNWFHRPTTTPTIFPLWFFVWLPTGSYSMWNCIYWFVLLVEMMIIWTWIAAFHDIKYHFKVHFGKEKEREIKSKDIK